MLKNTL